MSFGLFLLTNGCNHSIPHKDSVRNGLISLDSAIVCTTFVLSILAFTGTLSLPPAAAYTLMGVGVALIVFDIASFIHDYRTKIYIKEVHFNF